MPADRISLSALLGSGAELRKLADRLTAGQTGVYPTETIYGIGGRGDNTVVEQAVRSAKGRGEGAPFILIGARTGLFDNLGLSLPPAACRLAECFWPDRMTLVVPNDRGGTTAIRLSSHPLLVALSPLIEFPLISTSANPSGRPYIPDPSAIYTRFRKQVDFMVDGGPLPPSLPSSIVSVDRKNRVVLLREGALSREEIAGASIDISG